eukprot:TRINITY_DN3993_c0_g1_i1.p1 TRINITY_DN3993_c0_g1~~TRINITY_DN3993_c0_g1_i1.p1  ORF type:complete len:189 (-),score=51.20 TRINITY_DN3993_c0_g1_i1:197-763(-)
MKREKKKGNEVDLPVLCVDTTACILRARQDLQREFDSLWGRADFDNDAPKLESGPSSSSSSSENNQQLANSGNFSFNALWRPTVDLRENEKSYIVHAELPGLRKEDINIDVHDGVLSISGERKFEHKEEKEKYHRVERSYGKFYRSFAIPKTVDPSTINANFNDGVLEVVIAKPPQEVEPAKKRIEIK